MGKEDQEGLGNVAAASKKKDEDPLPFLRKPSIIVIILYYNDLFVPPIQLKGGILELHIHMYYYVLIIMVKAIFYFIYCNTRFVVKVDLVKLDMKVP